MKSELKERIKKNKVKLAAIDAKTAERIERISKTTGTDAETLIGVAVEILEQSIGRQIIVHEDTSNVDFTINHFKKYQKIVNLG